MQPVKKPASVLAPRFFGYLTSIGAGSCWVTARPLVGSVATAVSARPVLSPYSPITTLNITISKPVTVEKCRRFAVYHSLWSLLYVRLQRDPTKVGYRIRRVIVT